MKTVFVTGGSGQLGKVVTELLASRGFEVLSAKFDITSDDECRKVIRNIKGKKLFALINIAGITKFGNIFDSSSQEFLNILEINIVGHFRLLKALHDQEILPERVINITSLNGILPWPKFAMYCASKFAAEGFGLSLRYELFPKVQITNIAPGAIYRSNSKSVHKGIRERYPILKYLLPFTTDEYIAQEIVSCLNKDFMPARIIVGIDAKIVYWLQKLLPFWLFDKFILWLR